MATTRKKLRDTLVLTGVLIFVLVIISAALKTFNPIDNDKIYGLIQAIIRSLVLFFLLVFFSSLQQLRRKIAGIVEFFLSRLISAGGLGLTIGGIESKRIPIVVYLILSVGFSAYVLLQGLDIK